MTDIRIAPSILSADFCKLGEEVQAVLAAGADMIHFDVMDNHYVPNLTVGPCMCASLAKAFPDTIIDVHIMAKPVDELIKSFAKAGATNITIHPDATHHLHRSIDLIRSFNCNAGIALNPATPIDGLDYILDKTDIILLMSVNPGFGGQSFIPEMLDKLKNLHDTIKTTHPNISIAVDGGITLNNINDVVQAGADTIIAGSTIYGTDDYRKIISQLRSAIQ